jgi:hypothetical protein
LSSENYKDLGENDREIEGNGKVNDENLGAKNILESGEVSKEVAQVAQVEESRSQYPYSEEDEDEEEVE